MKFAGFRFVFHHILAPTSRIFCATCSKLTSPNAMAIWRMESRTYVATSGSRAWTGLRSTRRRWTKQNRSVAVLLCIHILYCFCQNILVAQDLSNTHISLLKRPNSTSLITTFKLLPLLSSTIVIGCSTQYTSTMRTALKLHLVVGSPLHRTYQHSITMRQNFFKREIPSAIVSWYSSSLLL